MPCSLKCYKQSFVIQGRLSRRVEGAIALPIFNDTFRGIAPSQIISHVCCFVLRFCSLKFRNVIKQQIVTILYIAKLGHVARNAYMQYHELNAS